MIVRSSSSNFCFSFLYDLAALLRLVFKQKRRRSSSSVHGRESRTSDTSTSSLPNLFLTKPARRAALAGSAMSSWWNTTSCRPSARSLAAASVPLLSSRAVRTTASPPDASCRHISNPMPRFPPVTRATLTIISRSIGEVEGASKQKLSEDAALSRC